jgi:hypothetical protein
VLPVKEYDVEGIVRKVAGDTLLALYVKGCPLCIPGDKRRGFEFGFRGNFP